MNKKRSECFKFLTAFHYLKIFQWHFNDILLVGSGGIVSQWRRQHIKAIHEVMFCMLPE